MNDQSRRRVLITGGGGFIGRHLVNGFADRGFAVTVLDFSGEGPERDDVALVQADIRDKHAVMQACTGMDTVVHNASLVHTRQNQADAVRQVNYDGTLHVMEACLAAGVQRLVYISSASAVYEGEDIENGDESLPYSATSQAPYADSKIIAEKAVLEFDGTGCTRTCAIRPHVVFGPGDTRFMPAILEKAEKGLLKRAVGNRDKLSDFTYIDNLVDAVLAAEENLVPDSPVCGQAYFVTNGEPMAFFDFVEKVVVALGYPPIKGRVPYWLAWTVAAVAEGLDALRGKSPGAESGMTRFAMRYMVTHHYYSIARAREDLGWIPRVDLEEGIRRTVAALDRAGHGLPQSGRMDEGPGTVVPQT